MTDAYLASSRLTPVLIVLVIAAIWFGGRRMVREGRFGYSLPARVKHPDVMSPDTARALDELLRPGERAWEPLAVADWELEQRIADDGTADDRADPEPDAAGRWLVLTSARILAVRVADGGLDTEIPIASITNLGLAPLPGSYTRKRSGIAIQADTPDGHRRWLWSGSANEAPGWVLQARDVIEESMPEEAGQGATAKRGPTWPLESFAAPERVDLPTGHHLRPLRESDVALDYPAVMGSRERLWQKYREAWGWPPADMTYDEDRRDLARHEGEIARGDAFVYAIFDEGESELVGCVYIDPPDSGSPPGTDAVVSWWVVDRMVGTDLDRELATFVPGWMSDTWGFRAVHVHP